VNLPVVIILGRAPYTPTLDKLVYCLCYILEKNRGYSFHGVGVECGMDRRTIRDYSKLYPSEVKKNMAKKCAPKQVIFNEYEETLTVDPPRESNNLLQDLLVCVIGTAILTSPIWLPPLINKISARFSDA